MHGNVEKNMDDSLPLQLVVEFFFYRYVPRGGFSKKLIFLNSRWAWFSCDNRNT